jgi:hypothetical protein
MLGPLRKEARAADDLAGGVKDGREGEVRTGERVAQPGLQLGRRLRLRDAQPGPRPRVA